MMFAIISASDPICSHNGLEHIHATGQISMACSMTFQGAWAPVMSWTLTFESGFIRRLSSVNRGTAADVTQLNTRYDYSVNYTLTDVASTFYVDKWINFRDLRIFWQFSRNLVHAKNLKIVICKNLDDPKDIE